MFNTSKNKNELRKFATSIAERLKEKPLKVYTDTEIKNSKYPHRKCSYCQQLGCDFKYKGFFCHKKCHRFVVKETKHFSKNILKL